MSAATWRRLRVLGGVLILAVIVWRVGTAPVLDGLRDLDARSVLIAIAIEVPATVCAAWRWRLVSRGLGTELALGPAVARYYRSQFINSVLPGGVLGDVHRGLDAGRDAGDPVLGLRAVFWERTAGQVVQLTIAIVVLVAFPSPVRSSLPALAVAAFGVVGALALLDRFAPRLHTAWWARGLRAGRSDLRHGLLAAGVWPGVLLNSTVAVAGYVALFLLAARTAGVDASTTLLLPLGMLAVLAMGIPANIAGWGPREGVTVWAFAAAGLGAGAGLTTAVVYGLLTFAACLPGAVVLLVLWRRANRREAAAETDGRRPEQAGVGRRE